MNKETEIMARMNALNNAAIAMQATLEKFEEPQNIEDVADKIIEIAREKFLKFILEPLEKEENPFIMIYINKGKYDPDDEKYKDFFEKNGFKKSPQGGWHKRIRQQEYNKWLNEEKDGKKINDWILRAFEVKTQVADVQEEEK
ncbi:MAG TPA: hypothetical protein ENI53_01330 [Thermoplasmatales archaeon]|nr:hypothetical protein [Thermoplasmatales archaeon]